MIKFNSLLCFYLLRQLFTLSSSLMLQTVGTALKVISLAWCEIIRDLIRSGKTNTQLINPSDASVIVYILLNLRRAKNKGLSLWQRKQGKNSNWAKVYILHNTREPIFAPTQCCGSGKIRKREDEERNLKKRRTRDRRNEEKDPRDKRKKGKKIKKKKRKSQRINIYYNKMRVQRKID